MQWRPQLFKEQMINKGNRLLLRKKEKSSFDCSREGFCSMDRFHGYGPTCIVLEQSQQIQICNQGHFTTRNRMPLQYNKELTNQACLSRTGKYWPMIVLTNFSPVRPSGSISNQLLLYNKPQYSVHYCHIQKNNL